MGKNTSTSKPSKPKLPVEIRIHWGYFNYNGEFEENECKFRGGTPVIDLEVDYYINRISNKVIKHIETTIAFYNRAKELIHRDVIPYACDGREVEKFKNFLVGFSEIQDIDIEKVVITYKDNSEITITDYYKELKILKRWLEKKDEEDCMECFKKFFPDCCENVIVELAESDTDKHYTHFSVFQIYILIAPLVLIAVMSACYGICYLIGWRLAYMS